MVSGEQIALLIVFLQSYWASYHLDNGITISEQITLSESEEDVTVPGKVRVIFDFEHVSLKSIGPFIILIMV